MATRIREKAVARAENKDMRPQATAAHIRMTPNKARMVLNLVRGKTLSESIAILSNINHAAAEVVKKVILSAAANAENNLNLDKNNLFVAECYANAGPTFKRLNPRAKGNGNIILKRTTHITVILDSVKA